MMAISPEIEEILKKAASKQEAVERVLFECLQWDEEAFEYSVIPENFSKTARMIIELFDASAFTMEKVLFCQCQMCKAYKEGSYASVRPES